MSCFIFLSKFIDTLWSYKKHQKVVTGRTVGQRKIKSWLAQTIPDKVFGIKRSTSVKLDKKTKVWYLFLRAF